ncbi:putative calcium binding protein [Paragonimus heterotremus]|uniref:Putative calcium binding protein n=1 Tax=Paragonimus heterotremus TaxID=100268 RepID=A0A8J4WJ83_9TREM|nr:putative calcium binding protein [Paragonimus heterotremus]
MKSYKDLDVRFTNLDLNGDGKISRDEYEAELKRVNLPTSMLDKFMKTYDTNGDGYITRQEFVQTLTQLEKVKPHVCSPIV